MRIETSTEWGRTVLGLRGRRGQRRHLRAARAVQVEPNALRHSAPVTLQPLQSDASGPPAESKAPAHAPLPLYTSSRLSHRPLATDPAPSLQGSGLRRPAFQTRRNGSRTRSNVACSSGEGWRGGVGGRACGRTFAGGLVMAFPMAESAFPMVDREGRRIDDDRQRARETR